MNFENIHSDWGTFLENQKSKDYFQKLTTILEEESKKYNILPDKNVLFKALELSPSKIKVVILGQDPYPTLGHANGLCFSVNDCVSPLPKSLINIFKEIKRQYPDFNPKNGNLQHWFDQGVFLLNTILTLREGEPLSHKRYGWGIFTQNLINYLCTIEKNIVFLLWGKNAHLYESKIETSENLIIKTSHPSPLGYPKSGYDFKSFKDSNQFIEANNYLSLNNKKQIHW